MKVVISIFFFKTLYKNIGELYKERNKQYFKQKICIGKHHEIKRINHCESQILLIFDFFVYLYIYGNIDDIVFLPFMCLVLCISFTSSFNIPPQARMRVNMDSYHVQNMVKTSFVKDLVKKNINKLRRYGNIASNKSALPYLTQNDKQAQYI